MSSLAYYIVHGTKPGQSMEGHRTLELYCEQFKDLEEDFEVTITKMNPLALLPYRIPDPQNRRYYLKDRFTKKFVGSACTAAGHVISGAVVADPMVESQVLTLGGDIYFPRDLGLHWALP